jgi:cobalt-zinc-cadmium efflux system membrane fusion protein
LVVVFSRELAQAKNDYLTTEIKWQRTKKLLATHRKLFAEKEIPEQLLVDSQNKEQKIALDFLIARSRLKNLGLDDVVIGQIGNEDGDQKPRLTIAAPADGTIIRVDAVIGNLYDKSDTLIVIRPNPSVHAPAP